MLIEKLSVIEYHKENSFCQSWVVKEIHFGL